ncbi:MAG: SpoIIE family protein phosphatase [Clostridia bacterium]|nr:SpoIIE family protein phosphatase [Clostridia bacterium]
MGKTFAKIKPIQPLAAVTLVVLCCGGSVYGLTPFGTPMYCAVASGVNIAFVAPIYLLCAFLFTFDVWRLYAAGAVIAVSAAGWLLSLKFPKRVGGRIAKSLVTAVAIIAETVISALFVPIADAVITGVVAAVFTYFALNLSDCVRDGFAYRLGAVQAASVCVAAFVAGLAFSRAETANVTVGLVGGAFMLLIGVLLGKKQAVCLGCSVAVGAGFNGNTAFVPALVMFVLIAVVFDRLPRAVYALTATGVFAAVAVLFGADPVIALWDTLCVAGGGLLFVILPRRAVTRVRAYFDYDGSTGLAVRHYINRTRADAGDGMLAVATVFDETARLLNAMNPPAPDFASLGSSLADGICPYCPKYNECNRDAAGEAFAELAEKAHGGRAILAELPEFFTRDCIKTVDAVSAATAITKAAREREAELATEGKAKAIVTERLAAASDVLEQLGKAKAQPVGFDGEAEAAIAAELNNSGVPCADVFCSQGGVTAIVRTENATHASIGRAVSVCLKRKYEVSAIEKTQAAGWSVATLKKRPMYEAVYARAGLGKNGITGDSYTFKRIGDKFLTALLDGMGSGVRACESSSAAVELIECFYRAGFDSQSALVGVNRFLKLPSAENYSAADVVVCDLDTASVDIIKIGAPPCYIKTQDTVLKIEGSSLPIGVLDEMRPFVTTKKLYPGQMLMLVTDGVGDCFQGDELAEFINGLSAFNPQTAVTAVLDRALALSGGVPKDDMTAIAFRLFDAPKKNKNKLATAK